MLETYTYHRFTSALGVTGVIYIPEVVGIIDPDASTNLDNAVPPAIPYIAPLMPHRLRRTNHPDNVSPPAVTAIVSYSKGFACAVGLGTVHLYEKADDKEYFKRVREIKVSNCQLVRPRLRYAPVILLHLLKL